MNDPTQFFVIAHAVIVLAIVSMALGFVLYREHRIADDKRQRRLAEREAERSSNDLIAGMIGALTPSISNFITSITADRNPSCCDDCGGIDVTPRASEPAIDPDDPKTLITAAINFLTDMINDLDPDNMHITEIKQARTTLVRVASVLSN